jgi:hypothetical protein
MNEDYEKQQLKGELEQLKREKKSLWVMWFLAIWLLPLLGMQLLQGDDPAKTTGPDFPVVGHMSIWGYWFVGVPLVTFLYRKFMRQPPN